MRSTIICATLVASSAAGSVALSVLHGIAPEYRVKAMAPSPEISEQRFVIPAFAPVSRDAAVSSAMLQTPAQPVAATADGVPVVRASVSDDSVLAEPVETVTQAAVEIEQADVEDSPQPAAPRIVAQANSFVSDVPTIQLTYLIGVYR